MKARKAKSKITVRLAFDQDEWRQIDRAVRVRYRSGLRDISRADLQHFLTSAVWVVAVATERQGHSFAPLACDLRCETAAETAKRLGKPLPEPEPEPAPTNIIPLFDQVSHEADEQATDN